MKEQKEGQGWLEQLNKGLNIPANVRYPTWKERRNKIDTLLMSKWGEMCDVTLWLSVWKGDLLERKLNTELWNGDGSVVVAHFCGLDNVFRHDYGIGVLSIH